LGIKLSNWIEDYLFSPTPIQKIISFLLLPLTAIYCLVILFKKYSSKPKDYGVKIISIGNLVVGGSGKTPVTIALAKNYKNCAVILRGYKRESKGLIVVSRNGKILNPIKQSGDEAMLIALSLKNATVIVSEDRKIAIEKAKSFGIETIFLDDGFSKKYINKFDILLRPKDEPKNSFCLPSGAYREPKSFYKDANLLLFEEVDYKRVVSIKNPTSNMIIITSISRPNRLFEYIPKYKLYSFGDHSFFEESRLKEIIKKESATSILVTTKDYVKLKDYDLPISIIELDIEFNSRVLEEVNGYLSKY
jgi:tetraacyldisaccharide 4'-kinase